MNEKIRIRLLSELTDWDKKQSAKKFYNRFAFAQYCAALNKVCRHCDNGAELRIALLNCFNGQLLDKLLKVCNLEQSTKNEKFGIYQRLQELDD